MGWMGGIECHGCIRCDRGTISWYQLGRHMTIASQDLLKANFEPGDPFERVTLFLAFLFNLMGQLEHLFPSRCHPLCTRSDVCDGRFRRVGSRRELGQVIANCTERKNHTVCQLTAASREQRFAKTRTHVFSLDRAGPHSAYVQL